MTVPLPPPFCYSSRHLTSSLIFPGPLLLLLVSLRMKCFTRKDVCSVTLIAIIRSRQGEESVIEPRKRRWWERGRREWQAQVGVQVHITGSRDLSTLCKYRENLRDRKERSGKRGWISCCDRKERKVWKSVGNVNTISRWREQRDPLASFPPCFVNRLKMFGWRHEPLDKHGPVDSRKYMFEGNLEEGNERAAYDEEQRLR